MRRIKTDLIKQNAVLDENIYASNGTLLIGKGTKLTAPMINRLKRMGYQKVAVVDERFEGMEIESQDPLTEQTKVQAIATTKEVLEEYKKSGIVSGIEQISDTVDGLLTDIMQQEDIEVDMTSLQNYDLGTYTHSLSVTVLTLYLARKMKFNNQELKDIGIGCLLHDLGKMDIPLEILNKPGKLTKEEYEIVKKHPFNGFSRLKDRIPLLAAHIALQHHEKFDGTGYPRGLKKYEIHTYSRITAVADVYDAVTSERPYRGALKPNEAVELIMGASGTHFDPQVLNRFLTVVSPYPNGSIVRLNTQAKAIVTQQNRGFPLRPVVFIFKEKNKLLPEYKRVDLKEELDLTIEDILDE